MVQDETFMQTHFYRYYRNFAIGVGIEKTWTKYWALRVGLGWWCFSITWRGKHE